MSVVQVMELETGVQVTSNQVGRQEDENKRLQDSLEISQTEVKRLQAALGEQRRKFTDLEGQVRLWCAICGAICINNKAIYYI